MGKRPETLTALADSPIGLATFMIDHDARSLELIARSFDGLPEGLTREAASAFPGELYQAPKSWAEKAYPKLVHYNRLPKGGHFAAWGQPKLFREEMRSGFRSLW